MRNLRLAGAGALMFLAIAVDFYSKILSMAGDALFIGAAVVVLLPLLKRKD